MNWLLDLSVRWWNTVVHLQILVVLSMLNSSIAKFSSIAAEWQVLPNDNPTRNIWLKYSTESAPLQLWVQSQVTAFMTKYCTDALHRKSISTRPRHIWGARRWVAWQCVNSCLLNEANKVKMQVRGDKSKILPPILCHPWRMFLFLTPLS